MKSTSIRRAALALGGAFGVLLSLEPFSFPFSWLVAPVCLFYLSQDLVRAGWSERLLWSVLACIATSSIAFQWLVVALVDIGEMSLPAALAFFLVQAPLFNLKIVLIVWGGAWLSTRTRLPRPLLFGSLALAGDLFTFQAFPWFWGNLAGSSPLLRQAAALGGVYFLSFLVYFGAVALLELRRAWRGDGIGRTVAWPAVVFALAYAYGLIRILTLDAGGETLRAAFFQPVTGRALKSDHDAGAFATRALNLSFNYGLKTIIEEKGRLDLLAIPETAVPFLGTNPSDRNRATTVYSPTYHGVVAYLARYGDIDVLYNELDVIEPPPPGSQRPPTIHNLATVYGREGRRRASYIKQKLVPFGEYLPGEDRFPALREIFIEAGYYRPGDSARIVEYRYVPDRSPRSFVLPTAAELEGLARPAEIEADWPERAAGKRGLLAPLICYEGMWPALVRGFFTGATNERPDILINISNDAWFGDYLANWQHFDAVRIRSIETNRYLVRATLTGAGGVIDPLGRDIVPRTPLGQPAIRAFDLPRRPSAWTIYLTVGEIPVYVILLACSLFAFALRENETRS